MQEELKRVNYNAVEMPDGSVGFEVSHLGENAVFSVVQIAGMLLHKVRRVAETALKTKVTDCVISMPVFFNDEQRHALLAAAKIAGLNCLRLLSETSAVALSYGIYKTDLPPDTEKPHRVVFCDMGAATLQMAACEFVRGKVTVLCTAHDASLGGRDFDEVIFNHFCDEFKTKYKMDIRSNVRAAWKLRLECEKLKQSMSANSTKLPLNIECLMDEKDVAGHMARDQFEQLALPLLERVEKVATDLLAALASVSDRKLTAADIDAVEVVGGNVRIPTIKAVIGKVFGRDISTTLNLDEVVAKGCALSAAIISPAFRVREFEVVDKTPYSISLQWPAKDTKEQDKDGSAEVFQAHGTAKLTKMLTYFRSSDCEFVAKYTNPKAVVGHVSEIGHYKISGITPALDGSASKVKIGVRLDEFGCFHITEATMVEKLPSTGDETEAMDTATEEKGKAEAGAPEAAADSAPTADKPAEVKKGKDSKEKADEPAKKKAKTHKNISLTVVETKPFVLSAQKLLELVEKENELSSEDRKQEEKSNAKNELEEYVYYIRDKLSEEDIQSFIKASDRELLQSKLSQTEDWLYDEGEDQEKSVYVAKLGELRALGDPMMARFKEASKRPQVEEAFRRGLVRVRKFLDLYFAGTEQYAHLTAEEVDKVKAELEKKEAWLNDQMKAQAKQLSYEPPVITASAMQLELDTLSRICDAVINKPKPKVEPPKPTPEDKPASEEKPAAGEDGTTAPSVPSDEKPAGGEPSSEKHSGQDGAKMDTSD